MYDYYNIILFSFSNGSSDVIFSSLMNRKQDSINGIILTPCSNRDRVEFKKVIDIQFQKINIPC